MYCGQCGKKVMENMLFCPFCGSPIVIPEQDAHSQEAPAPAETAQESAAVEVQSAPERPVSLFDEFDFSAAEPDKQTDEKVPAEAFVPLNFDCEAEDEEEQLIAPAPAEVVPEYIHEAANGVDTESAQARPTRRNAPELLRPENAQRRSTNTYIPMKELAPTDIFMDGLDEDDDFDDYDGDAYDAPRSHPARYADEDDDFDFEEPERGSFLQRHIRGVVSLILLVMVAAICMIWAVSSKGQQALAQVNLAWKAQAYADLGYSAYQQGSDLLAARYYEKALAREEGNYEYAHSAMVAYYEANEIESAAAMLKKCIELSPDDPEPYMEMLILYPDAENRPWEITELVRQGYQRTGNEALKLD